MPAYSSTLATRSGGSNSITNVELGGVIGRNRLFACWLWTRSRSWRLSPDDSVVFPSVTGQFVRGQPGWRIASIFEPDRASVPYRHTCSSIEQYVPALESVTDDNI